MEETIGWLKTAGPYGVIAVLLWTVRELDKRLRDSQTAHTAAMQAAQAALQAEHEKRLEDQRQATKALLEQSHQAHEALKTAAEVIDTLNSSTTMPRRLPR